MLNVLFALSLSASASGPTLRLDLEPGLVCGLDATLPMALAKADVRIAGSDAEWILRARRDGEGVQLRLSRAQSEAVLSRRFKPTLADCSVLPRAAALLVRSWLDAQLESPQPEMRAEVSPVPESTPMPGASLQSSTHTATLLPRMSAPTVDIESPAEPARAAAPTVPASAEFVVSSALPLGRRDLRSLSLMVSGGGTFATNDSVATGRLGLEWGFAEPWAASLDAGFQSLRTAVNVGTVRVSLQFATLAVRRSFFGHLHIALGAQLIRFEASAVGFSAERKTANMFTGGAVASVEWRQDLVAGLFLLGRLNAQARWPQTFSIVGLGSLVRVPAWGVGLEAGVGWNFL